MRCVKCECIIENVNSDGLCQRCEFAAELKISLEDADKVISRMKDIDDPSKWSTLDEFLEEFDTLKTGDRDVTENNRKE